MQGLLGLERTTRSGSNHEFPSAGNKSYVFSVYLKFVLTIHWVLCAAQLKVVLKSFLQLFYKNGQPFPAHRPVGLRVNITHIELALEVPVTQEVLQEPESNVVKVAFTVRKAGRYEVAVKLGGLNVAYSPYYKIFQPGKMLV